MLKEIRYSVTILFVVLFSLQLNAQSIALDWVDDFSGFSNYSRAMTIDENKNVYTIGNYSDGINFGTGTYSGGTDAFYITKHDSLGNLLWVVPYSNSRASCSEIKVDGNGDVYVSGFYLYIYDGPTYVNDDGYFLLKLDSEGNKLWLKRWETNVISVNVGIQSIYGLHLAIDNVDNVYLAGTTFGDVDANPDSSEVFMLNQIHNRDFFMVKLNSSGDFVWAKQIGGVNHQQVKGIDVDVDGNLYCAGSFQETTDFDPSTNVYNVTANPISTSGEGFVCKLDSGGNFVWVSIMEKQTTQSSIDVKELDVQNDKVFVTGWFRSIDFDGSVNEYVIDTTGTYVLKLATDGSFGWVKSINYPANIFVSNDIISDDNFIYLTGSFKGEVDFNPSTVDSFTLDSEVGGNNLAAYYLKLDSNGNFLSVFQLENQVQQSMSEGVSIGYDNLGNIFGTGFYRNEVDFNPQNDTMLLSSNFHNTYVLKFKPCTVTSSSISPILCDTTFTSPSGNYTWNVSGNYMDTLSNSTGCDSIIYIDLTISESNWEWDNHYVCDSLTWVDGNTYYSSNNTATYLTTNSSGCDSLVKLYLNVKYSTSSTDSYSVCDSLTWIDGNTYYSSNNTATYIINNSVGCDSLITLDLTISQYSSTVSTDSIKACGQYTWIDGNTYVTDNVSATHTLVNAQGCDSIITLSLDIGQPTQDYYYQEACDSIFIAGSYYYSSQMVSIPATFNEWGCVHTWNYDVVINQTPDVTMSPFIKNPMCLKDNISPLPSVSPIGGTFFGHGVSDANGTFDPDWADLGVHTITYEVEGAGGCIGKDSVDITVVESPDFSYSTDSNTVTLIANTTCLNYYWDFGDGNTNSLSSTPVYTYMNDGAYTLCLVCNDLANCVSCVNLSYPSAVSGSVNGVIGIEETLESDHFSIYPNPNQGKFTLIYDVNIGGAEVELYSMSGQLLKKYTLSKTENSLQVDVSSFENGLYIVSVKTKQGVVVKRLVKN